MELKTRISDGVTILDIAGEITVHNAPRIREHISEQIEKGSRKMIINMQEVTGIDSSGIGALVHALTNQQKVGGALKVTSISESVRRIIELMKLQQVFDIYDSDDEAMASF